MADEIKKFRNRGAINISNVEKISWQGRLVPLLWYEPGDAPAAGDTSFFAKKFMHYADCFAGNGGSWDKGSLVFAVGELLKFLTFRDTLKPAERSSLWFISDAAEWPRKKSSSISVTVEWIRRCLLDRNL